MSSNPGEPEHEIRGWTHAACDLCYFRTARDRGRSRIPSRMVDPQTGLFVSERCCYCGLPSRGIYVRDDPAVVHGEQTAVSA